MLSCKRGACLASPDRPPVMHDNLATMAPLSRQGLMHTCPPPLQALADWLNGFDSIEDGNFGHLLLEQKGAIDNALVAALRPYFESAHDDARDHFHAQIGISLHPDAPAAPAVSYPGSLPDKAKRGLFGEVMAGLVTEAYQDKFVGGHAWIVPIFLFREHDDVEKYLWALRFDPDRQREIYGRHGTDFIAIALNDTGEVVRVIAGEAKWRRSLTTGEVAKMLLGPKVRDEATGVLAHDGKGVWHELNRDTPIPHGLRQLQRLLELRAPDAFEAAILSIDRAVLLSDPTPGRTNLVVIVGNAARRREQGDVLVDWETKPDAYTAPHDLQVVEVILEGGENLIDALYGSLWSTP